MPRPSQRAPILFALVLWPLGLLPMGPAGASPLGRGEPAVATASPEDKLQRLLDLADDPEVRALLARRRGGVGDVASAPEHGSGTMAGGLGDELEGLRNRVRSLAAAAPRLPEEFDHARGMLVTALGSREIGTLVLFVAAFVAIGFGFEWLFRRWTVRARTWLLALHLDTVEERVRAVFARLLYGLGLVAAYGVGSIGAFLLFDWSALLKEILLGYLLASLVVRLAAVFGRFFFAPGAERFRVAPISTPAAMFLYRRLMALALLVAVGWQTLNLLGAFGFSAISRELSADVLGVFVLALALETVWRVPRERLAPAPSTEPSGGDAPIAVRHHHRATGRIAASLTLLVLWGLWVANAVAAFWIAAFAVGLPALIVMTQRSIHHVLRPSDDEAALASHRLEVVFLERGVRSLLIVAAALGLGHLLGVDFVSLTMQDTVTTRILRGVLSVVIIALVADFLWHATAAIIDRKLASNVDVIGVADDSGHAARLQTLLPILKNVLMAVLVVLAGMMMLAAMGVEIGPLIASAGVVGVAIGFGAQTLVKDIISGIFYLVDDAFRIGEYIQSGTYKGTVESFSLRSVKLRHQRGALYTVPFGVLGAVQNQSRDWVVDKITINVPYETDLEKVRKIIKRIGETLAEDPDLGPDIIKPIKMQGVAQFGDYAIQIVTKMMTKPGDVQFSARRRALIMIKQAFEANAIGFALPMVHVSGEGGRGAAAQQVLLHAAKTDVAA